jgi:hypothetical protein
MGFALRLASIALVVAVGLFPGLASGQAPVPKADVDWVVSVILPEAKPLEPARLSAALRKRVTEKDRLTGVEPDKDIVLLRVAGGTAFVGLMKAPIPRVELQRTCRDAWLWREACDAVRDHEAHFLVILMGTGLGKMDSALLQTKIVAAVLEASNAVAAYWGTSLSSRAAFLAQSEKVAPKPESLPTWLWVSYRVTSDADNRFSISTDGLREFNLMEIETKDAPMTFRDLYGLVQGTAAYLIAKGPIIRDGDTVGHTARQRIRVRHGKSYWRSDKVYRLELGD